MITAHTTHAIAYQVSLLPRAKSSALKNITVSTHSRTTLAKARIESIQSCQLVTIFSTLFFIFFPISLKFAFVHMRNCVIMRQAAIMSIPSYIFSVFQVNPPRSLSNHTANIKLIAIQTSIPSVIYLFLFFSTPNTLSIENIRPIIIAASSVSRNVTIKNSI